jgi:uncharacterized protein involved in exopolysaccharide biosynthesis
MATINKDEATEQLIKNTAKRLVFVEGKFNATTQEIADAAGVNRTLINYYFRSRDNLFDMVFKDAKSKERERTSSIIFSELPFKAKIAEFIDNSFGLRQRWGGSQDNIYARLALSTKVVPSPSGIIGIEVSDTDPVWAAKLANGYVSALQAITQELAVNEASKRRLFYEQQMNVALYQLTIAETALRKIQQETGVLKLDTQIEMAIRESSRLRAEIASKETELAAMKAFATEGNPDYLRLKYEVEALRRQLAQWRQPAQTNADLSMQTSEGLLPEISMEYVKRYREVKNLELVYELFLKELQLTRIDQVKDATMIELLDRAVPPSTPSYPRKKRIVIIAGFVGLLLGVLLVLAYELLKVQLQYEENMRRMNLIGVEVKGYFSFRQKLKGFKWMRKK